MTMLRERPEVVCKECEWGGDRDRMSRHGLEDCPPEEWKCFAPTHALVAIIKEWCPMTGREQTNYPLCRVVNEDGECEHYEPRNAEG